MALKSEEIKLTWKWIKIIKSKPNSNRREKISNEENKTKKK